MTEEIEKIIKELKTIEYYIRPFDNSTEATNEANNKIKALYRTIQLLEKLKRIIWLLNN